MPLPKPLHEFPSATIEKVYPCSPGSDIADIHSQEVAIDYLNSRYGDSPNEGRPPEVVPYLVEKTRFGWGGHFWAFGGNLKRSLAITGVSIALSALANVIYNERDFFADPFRGTTPKEFPQNGPRLLKMEFPVPITIPGHEASYNATYHSEVGKTEYKPTVISFLDYLEELKAQDASLKKINIYGGTSDEYLAKSDGGLKHKDIENDQLGHNRAQIAKTDLLKLAKERGIELPSIEIHSVESVLSPKLHDLIERTAQQFGYADVKTAIAAFKQPDKLPPALRELLEAHIGKKRGPSLTLEYITPDETKVLLVPRFEPIPPSDEQAEPKKDDGWKWFPCFIPLFPLPKLPRKYKKLVEKTKVIPGVGPQDEWLRIYREGVEADGKTLRPDAWAYTRKYQALLREGRVQQIYKANYQTGTGEEQSLQILFVDHVPTDRTLEGFEGMLQSFAQMRDGELTKNLNAIAVFPEENSGIAGNVPKQIGPGIDVQHPKQVLGVAFPGIKLAEMHMPTTLKPGESDNYFEAMEQALWTFTHEVNGHFSDLNGKEAQLSKIAGTNRYQLNNQWAERAEQLYRTFQHERYIQPRLWRLRQISRGVKGEAVYFDDYVSDNSPLLHRSGFIRLENRNHTIYGGSSAGEFWADGVAQAASGIGIKFSEQPDLLNPPVDRRFADRYAISTRLFDLIANYAGSDPTADTILWPTNSQTSKTWKQARITLEQDPALAELTKQAREWDFRQPYHPDVLHILTPARVRQIGKTAVTSS